MTPSSPDWSSPVVVAQFADRPPDVDFLRLLSGLDVDRPPRVLDLGCAGGRNTVAAADRGCQVVALDRALGMVRHTQSRVASYQPRPLVVCGDMAALPLPSASQDVVCSLGVYHQAETDGELLAALAETARVMRPGGWLLVSVFSPAMLPPETPRAACQQWVYQRPDGAVCRLTGAELTERLAAVGLVLTAPVETRCGPPESGRISHLAVARRDA